MNDRKYDIVIPGVHTQKSLQQKIPFNPPIIYFSLTILYISQWSLI